MLGVHVRRPDGSDAGMLTSWTDLQVVERWRDVGRWAVTVGDPVEAALVEPGGGVVVRRGDATVMSGPWDTLQVEQQGSNQVTTLSGPDDTGLLAQCLVWPTPGSPVTTQGAYDTRTGPAESVMLGYVVDNLVGRLYRSVVVPASQGRGAQVTIRGRFQTLLEVAREAFAGDPDLGFRLRQSSSRLIGVDVWRASDLTGGGSGVGLFSDLVGTVTGWVLTKTPPDRTRWVVAGGDEQADRMLRLYTDAAAESEWLVVAEGFKDRRDVDPEDETAETELAEAGTEALSESGAKVALRVQVEDTMPGLQYGVDFQVGDLVTVYPAGLAVEDRITEATLTVNRHDGERVAMWVGRKDDDPDERVERVARDFAGRLSDLERRY